MKYGETLRQRSIPGWAEHNIDYDEIKLLIKDYTTPGQGKAVSVPGQGNEAESDFEKRLFGIFVRENVNISLFVKTKVLEIERSLDDLDRRLRKLQLQSQSICAQPDQATLEGYRRLEQKTVISTGEVIKSLSRFIITNRTAVYKLLKKYKKWTGSDYLGPRVRAEVLQRTDSFARVDVEQLLNHWTAILRDVRLAMGSRRKFDELRSQTRSSSRSPQVRPVSGTPRDTSSDVVRHIRSSIQTEADLDFDLALAETALGDQGRRAVYWVHPDQLIELQVFLSNHLKLYPPRPSSRNSVSSHPNSSTHTRRTSLIRQDSPAGIDGDYGVILLDRLDDYAQRSSAAPIADTEETSGQSVVATVRWTTSDEAAICIKGIAGTENIKLARLRRRYVKAFLDLERSFKPWQDHDSSSFEHEPHSSTTTGSPDFVRNWLDAHRNIKPVVSICTRRSRFIDLNDGERSGQWCTLDSDIEMNKVTQDDLVARDWPLQGSDGWRFPHSVLEVRQEGQITNDLISMLDHSHLVERVRGFSMAYHAVYTCWQPKNMTQPFWLLVLQRDIRKLPEPALGRNRRRRQTTNDTQDGAKTQKASSTEDYTSEPTGSSTLLGESSGPSVPVPPAGPQPMDETKPKRKLKYAPEPPKFETNRSTRRYWNEYDYPEDGPGSGGDEGYYIYLDPNEKIQWPFIHFFQRIKSLFIRTPPAEKTDEEAQLLLPSPTSRSDITKFPLSSSATDVSEDESTTSSETDTTTPYSLNRWGVRRTAPLRTINHGTFPVQPHTRYTTHAIAPPEVRQQYSTIRLSTVSLTASVTLLITLSVLAAAGRKKQRGEVDAGVIFGVVATLAFAMMGILAALAGRREDPSAYGRVRWMCLVLSFVVCCVGSGALLAWVGGLGQWH